MLTHAEIVKILNQDVYSAEARLAETRQAVDALIAESPDSLPYPDGQHRITKAINEQNKAREALKRAVQRNCEFTLNGVVPEDLA